MKQRRRRVVAVISGGLAAGSLLLAGLVVTPAADARGDAEGDAVSRLRSDAPRGVTFEGDTGRFRFVGTAARRPVDNPEVTPAMGAAAAAQRHLSRYGAALGTASSRSTFEAQVPKSTPSGIDVVRYDQMIDGVPVIGAQVVIGLDAERRMVSASSTTSSAAVRAATVTEDEAERAALIRVARVDGGRDLVIEPTGRRVFDPSVFGATSAVGARTGWAFDVRGDSLLNRLVLVDDRDGRVLLDLDQNHRINRAVCDNGNVPRSEGVPCTTGVVRTETSGPTGTEDVDSAFDASGEVATAYRDLAGLDLTNLLGISVDGKKAIASTVGWCFSGDDCPYANAFWNGSQMYYGAGYVTADDVVGHEITHGVIERYSNLFYWGQSGAINESIADVMGEVVQHRNATTPAARTNWELGEDLPDGASRSLADPTLFGQPDSTGSALYTADDDTYDDNGGVHTNSGVGNKAAYLISQGGTFRGTTVVGIDAGDPGLTRTGMLYADVLTKLNSGSDYADLADALEQSCADLVSAATAGFTAATCESVHAATAATGMRTTPANAAQPAVVAQTCPAGTTKRILFDSENGDVASKFEATGSWVRGQSPYYGANATSGSDSWSITSPWDDRDVSDWGTLSVATPILIPAGQETYLGFNSWTLLDYEVDGSTTSYYDVGLVDLDQRVSDGSGGTLSGGTVSGEQLDWINGPSARMDGTWWGVHRQGFGGDSHGWTASRASLRALGGSNITPEFSLATDSSYLYPGWFLDDITVYTCDPIPLPKRVNVTAPGLVGQATVGSPMRLLPGTWSPSLTGAETEFGTRWFRDGVMSTIAGSTYTPVADDIGHTFTVYLSPWRTGYQPISVLAGSFTVKGGTFHLSDTKIRGLLKVGQWIVAPSALDNWGPGVRFTYQWKRNGKSIRKGTKFQYKLTKKDAGKRISVTVVVTRPGFATVTRTVSASKKVRR